MQDFHDKSTTVTRRNLSPALPCGVRLVVTFLTIHLLLVVFPAWSYFQYDFVSATLHLEEPRIFADEAVVQTNRSVGLTNFIWVIPLNMGAIVGLCCCGRNGRKIWCRRCGCCCCSKGTGGERQAEDTIMMIPTNVTWSPPFWAFTLSYMLLGVAIYWPIQFLCSRWTYSSANIGHVHLQGSDLVTLIMVMIMALSSTWYLSSYQHSLSLTVAGRNNNDHPNTTQNEVVVWYDSLERTTGLLDERNPLLPPT
ncbi:hypothetical protein IV203_022626 [Nitzschia inconspicua]|uniref:Uncharacterized protein n=1 Tax=Nitzschia inconspicua TaxID=303405 RepID=A0A9K3KJ32_9STRA|nr:hypothetical protein IV203_022626 [Nitzschia inconspicua]